MNSLLVRIKNNYKIERCLKIILLICIGLYVFLMPSFGSRGSLHIIPYFFMGLIVFLDLFLIAFYYPKIYQRIRWEYLIIPSFVIFSLIGTILFSHQYRNWLTIALLCITYFFLLISFIIIKKRDLVIAVLCISLSCFALYYFFHYRKELIDISTYTNQNSRLGSYFDNQNAIAAIAVIGSSLSLYLLLFVKKKIKYLCALSFLMFLIIGLSTGSKSFIVAFLLCFLIFTFFRMRKHLFIYFIFLTFLALLLIVVINLPVFSLMKDRFIQAIKTLIGIADDKADTSTITRSFWLRYGFYLGSNHLITGCGAGGFSVISQVNTYTHSNVSEVFCDFGIIGFVLFYSPLVIILFNNFLNKNRNLKFVFPFFAYYFLISFFNVFYYNKFYYIIIALLFFMTFEEPSIPHSNKYVLNKIIITCDTLSAGGAEKVISLLANQFTKLGIKANIIAISSKSTDSFYQLDTNIEYKILSTKRVNYLSKMIKLRRTIKLEKPDIVISFLPHVNVYTCLSLIGLNIPHVVSERNNPFINPKGKLLRFLKNYSFYLSNGQVFQTVDAQRFYKRKIRENSIIIDNPIELLCLPRKDNVNRRKEIVFVGRLAEQKNLFLLIDAFEVFHRENPSFSLIIYGDGPLKEKIINYINEKNMNNLIIFKGNVTNWHKEALDCSAFVLPSNYEGMPNSLMEALALRIPCISTNCPTGGPAKLIKDGTNGFLIETGDMIDLVTKLQKIISTDISDLFFVNNLDFTTKYSPYEIAKQWAAYLVNVLTKYKESF